MTKRVQGIILKKVDLRESDRLFVIYTDKLGKIEAVARGVKKIQSKMAGHLDFFSVIDFLIATGKNYYQVAGVEIAKNFSNLKSSLERIILGSHILEVTDNFTKAEYPDVRVYELVKESMSLLNDKKIKNYLKLYEIPQFFILKFLALLGWAPELYICIKCKKKITSGGNYFNVSKGSLTCGACGFGGIPVSSAALKILRFALQKDLRSLLALKINRAQFNEVVKIINYFLAFHQDKELKSAVWINYLRQLIL